MNPEENPANPRKKTRFKLLLVRKVILFSFVVAVAFSGGYFFGHAGFRAEISENKVDVNISRETPPGKENLDFSLFWRVWDTLYAKYYDKSKLDESQLVYGSIRGMVAAVGDPYTVFLPPKENKVVREDLQGSFEGVGIQIGFKGNQLAVMAPLPDSPAEKAGVKAGDFIIGITDEAKDLERGTAGITLPEAVQAIRGPKGSTVKLTLLREGSDDPLEVDIVREEIDVPSITVEYLGENKNVAHVKVLKFSGEMLSEWDETVIELLTKNDLDGLIMDVRNNPGGYLNGAVELASDFLENGDVVVIEESGSGLRNEYRVEKLGRLRTIKTVVLQNQGSASASEIFAGAMKDNERAKIIGTVSFGKGTIQEPQQVNGEAGLHITIARWLTPSEFWVNDGGLKPDIEVDDNEETEEDEQLQRAVEEITQN